MDAKQITILAAAALMIVVAFFLFNRGGGENNYGANNANLPDGLHYICSNPTCLNEFSMTVDEFSNFQEKHYGEIPKCPKCGTQATRADKCKHCGKYFIMQRESTICPHCKKDNVK